MRQRPIAVSVFGVLNICFALMKFGGLFLGAILANSGNPALATLKSNPGYVEWTQISSVVNLGLGIALITSGVGLLMVQNWARILTMVYAAIEIVFVGVGAIVTKIIIAPAMSSFMHGPSAAFIEISFKVGLVIGVVIGLAYPILLLIFMTRPSVVEACGPSLPPVENRNV